MTMLQPTAPALHAVDPTALIELFRLTALSSNELRVAAALARQAALVEGEPNVQLGRWEIANETGLSAAAVQRALGSLAESGWIGRSQDAKAKGEIAITTVTDRLLALFGIDGGVRAIPGLPNELLSLLARETTSVANAVTAAWAAAELPPVTVESEFRGGSRRWAEVEFLLRGRIESEAIATTIEAGEMSQRTDHVQLPDGTELTFSRSRFRDSVPARNTAMAGADMRFAVEVLNLVAKRSPKALSRTSAIALAAEALYSRQKGFVHRHDFTDAAKVVSSIIAKGTWSAPRGIDDSWYVAVGAAVQVTHRVFKSASLN